MTQVDEAVLARQAYDFWRPHVRLPIHAYAVLGDIEGECSFRADVVGDHGTAHGICQWHAARADVILKHTGVDVRKAPFADQLRAMLWEVTSPQSAYGHVLGALSSTSTLEAAVTVMVSRYEQSGSQARDVARRTALAAAWQKKLALTT